MASRWQYTRILFYVLVLTCPRCLSFLWDSSSQDFLLVNSISASFYVGHQSKLESDGSSVEPPKYTAVGWGQKETATISEAAQWLACETNHEHLGAAQACWVHREKSISKSQILSLPQPATSDMRCPRSQGDWGTNCKQMRSQGEKPTQRMSPSKGGS